MKLILVRILVAIFAVVFINGCSDMTSAKPAAESSVIIFHEKYNSKDFESIFNESHNDFKASANFDSFNEFMQAVYLKLGKVKSTENQNWNVKTFNLKTSVILVQNTNFEQGTGVETFTYRIKDKIAFLVGYNINSRDLIIK